MRLCFLTLPADERRLYIDQAAIRRNVSAVVLEKDFWACWLLGLLFGSAFAGSLVFKGGTSLSKVFGVIERFSEDIDRSLSPAFLQLPEAGTRRKASRPLSRVSQSASRSSWAWVGRTGLPRRAERTPWCWATQGWTWLRQWSPCETRKRSQTARTSPGVSGPFQWTGAGK
jgi:hypothetical protein